jgi:WhiB family transcriptional regulator, redox-sensing transcriptional regulator
LAGQYVANHRTDSHRKLARDMDNWAPDGACRGDLRFGDDATDLKTLKEICSGCKVRVECLTHALAYPEPDGIWGGLDIKERQRVRDSRREAARKLRNRMAKQ